MSADESIELKIRSSKGEIEQFKQSLTWLDFCDGLPGRVAESKHKFAALPGEAFDAGTEQLRFLAEIWRIDGTIRALEYVRDRALGEIADGVDESEAAQAAKTLNNEEEQSNG